MKAHIDRDWMSGRVRIWIYDRRHFLEADLQTWTEHAPETTPAEPTMVLREEVAEAVASALQTFGRPEESTRRHLDDAIKVRDRLLTLVEKS